MICGLPTPYPILIPARPKDFVSERKINKFSKFLRCFIIDSSCSGTSSINVSSTKTIVDFFFAAEIIYSISLFWIKTPVGLFGLQIKIQPFLGIFIINLCKFFERSIVLKNDILHSQSFAEISYSLNVGIGINTRVFLFRKVLLKL